MYNIFVILSNPEGGRNTHVSSFPAMTLEKINLLYLCLSKTESMIIYNITIKVANEIVAAWLDWMRTIHLPEMMQTGKFNSYRMCALEDVADDDDSHTFVVQYECETKEAYEAYISDHSESMRQKGIQQFGNRFIAFRTIMEVVHKG